MNRRSVFNPQRSAFIVASALFFAATLAMLILGGCKPYTTEENRQIHSAAQSGDVEKVRVLLKANPELVNAKAEGGWTALHFAVIYGHKEVVELLLANKAEVNARGARDMTPLLFAAQHGHKVIAEVLLANNADVNVKDEIGETPLQYAIGWSRSKEVAEVLLANHADVNVKSKNGITPLHTVASIGNKAMMELLLAYKADVNAKDNDGKTPLRWATNKDVAELLRANGGEE
jgi:ankyrin repeat protein